MYLGGPWFGDPVVSWAVCVLGPPSFAIVMTQFCVTLLLLAVQYVYLYSPFVISLVFAMRFIPYLVT